MFTIYGPGTNDPIHLEKLFAQGKVMKTVATAAKSAIDRKQSENQPEEHKQYAYGAANRHYRAMGHEKEESPFLRAEQIMTSPVISIQADASVPDVIDLLERGNFRHLPVLSSNQQLVGMISDRDIIRCVCGSDSVCIHCSPNKQDILVQSIMKSPVLTTAVDTDARHIARLFVERKIGAIPIMDGKSLAGIISRSDILRAVMHHFSLGLWA